ncbi:hypothetical protein BESB_036600 [Besnoitia besnoiti]|uniref:START domain-containing protein n=1 Tax=Besnoitia besnoiti TaxID=94643 RepID=A0A2A9MNG2_BESBE|nr:hypothetical protein BESB_036600 [Besnoitia besnoiti]PFH37202.1 hypothetical protein BESB_036600 [Besnoitia besnoiti]
MRQNSLSSFSSSRSQLVDGEAEEEEGEWSATKRSGSGEGGREDVAQAEGRLSNPPTNRGDIKREETSSSRGSLFSWSSFDSASPAAAPPRPPWLPTTSGATRGVPEAPAFLKEEVASLLYRAKVFSSQRLPHSHHGAPGKSAGDAPNGSAPLVTLRGSESLSASSLPSASSRASRSYPCAVAPPDATACEAHGSLASADGKRAGAFLCAGEAPAPADASNAPAFASGSVRVHSAGSCAPFCRPQGAVLFDKEDVKLESALHSLPCPTDSAVSLVSSSAAYMCRYEPDFETRALEEGQASSSLQSAEAPLFYVANIPVHLAPPAHSCCSSLDLSVSPFPYAYCPPPEASHETPPDLASGGPARGRLASAPAAGFSPGLSRGRRAASRRRSSPLRKREPQKAAGVPRAHAEDSLEALALTGDRPPGGWKGGKKRRGTAGASDGEGAPAEAPLTSLPVSSACRTQFLPPEGGADQGLSPKSDGLAAPKRSRRISWRPHGGTALRSARRAEPGSGQDKANASEEGRCALPSADAQGGTPSPRRPPRWIRFFARRLICLGPREGKDPLFFSRRQHRQAPSAAKPSPSSDPPGRSQRAEDLRVQSVQPGPCAVHQYLLSESACLGEGFAGKARGGQSDTRDASVSTASVSFEKFSGASARPEIAWERFSGESCSSQEDARTKLPAGACLSRLAHGESCGDVGSFASSGGGGPQQTDNAERRNAAPPEQEETEQLGCVPESCGSALQTLRANENGWHDGAGGGAAMQGGVGESAFSKLPPEFSAREPGMSLDQRDRTLEAVYEGACLEATQAERRRLSTASFASLSPRRRSDTDDYVRQEETGGTRAAEGGEAGRGLRTVSPSTDSEGKSGQQRYFASPGTCSTAVSPVAARGGVPAFSFRPPAGSERAGTLGDAPAVREPESVSTRPSPRETSSHGSRREEGLPQSDALVSRRQEGKRERAAEDERHNGEEEGKKACREFVDRCVAAGVRGEAAEAADSSAAPGRQRECAPDEGRAAEGGAAPVSPSGKQEKGETKGGQSRASCFPGLSRLSSREDVAEFVLSVLEERRAAFNLRQSKAASLLRRLSTEKRDSSHGQEKASSLHAGRKTSTSEPRSPGVQGQPAAPLWGDAAAGSERQGSGGADDDWDRQRELLDLAELLLDAASICMSEECSEKGRTSASEKKTHCMPCVYDKDGLKVWKKEFGVGRLLIRASFMLPVLPQQYASFASDSTLRATWDPHLGGHAVLETLTPHMDICRVLLKRVAAIYPRDIVTLRARRTWRLPRAAHEPPEAELQEGKEDTRLVYASCSCSIDHPDAPEHSSHVRMDIRLSAYVASPVVTPFGVWTEVTLFSEADPKGWIPAVVSKALAAKVLPSTVEKMAVNMLKHYGVPWDGFSATGYAFRRLAAYREQLSRGISDGHRL